MENQIPRKAVELYEKGEQALNNSNYDYAISLFEWALAIAPRFSDCRRKLRLAEFRKFDLEKPGAAGLYMKLIANIRPLMSGLFNFRNGRWLASMADLEKVLKVHPKNRFVLSKLAAAAEKEGMIDIAIDSLNAIRLTDQKDVSVIKEMARIYKSAGDLNEARQCYEDVLSISPSDPDAGPELRKIAAIGTIQQGAWDKTNGFRDKIRDEEQAKIFEEEAKLAKTDTEIADLINSLERKLGLSPDNATIMKNLSELYGQVHNYRRAAELIKKCIAMNPADPGLKKILNQIELKSIDREIHLAKEKAFDAPNDEKLAAVLADLENRKKHLRLADCVARVEQFPTNLSLRFELGALCVENDMIDRAISEFQLAVKTPNKKIQSLNYLGLCFKSKKMYDLAVEQFTAAIESLKEMTPLKKEIVYNLASTYEDMGNIEKAGIEYKKIYTIDIAFKDVAHKIEKIYRKTHPPQE